MVNYKFKFRPYQRKFARSLTTSHGNWDIRKGIILRLSDETGKVGWGEIAPISWFGSETLEQALDFCHQLPTELTEEIIFSIPDELPACQFGFESALGEAGEQHFDFAQWAGSREQGKKITNAPCPMPNSGLLSAGEVALAQWQVLWEQGYRTFKWKIGVDAIAQELKVFKSLVHRLPSSAKLRLDANGGLSYEEANLWLETCDRLWANIEFIEQPLPVEKFPQMLELNRCYATAIALDESVATLKQLTTCYAKGWRGIFVIKPGIVGSPSRLRQFCQQHKIDAVFSSVFETAIGRQAALQLATALSQKNRAVGFGVNHFFAQEETWLQDLCKDL
ncbi:o-succinylbenzoate synthase [Halotia branconii]|uniref:o-succinylbenzoate synthase n=1 Tax=Halotia branconii CENA392 TaxID=1539056 RepID=A0AAJ6NNL5_9CYAN|nr:o-succinylbenzoate synthase [Halotia branconii]WGV23708.1 o-succinylbenzoate synthase [Halotia branconii CENA392]